VLVEQRYELNGAQVPIPFSATIDRDLIGKKARLSVNARIEQQGKLRFISDRAYPPLKDGQPVPVDIVLKPAGRAPR
jgi:putative lipoprotein